MDKNRNDDPFNLERFVQAQDGVYEKALEEIAAGRKRSHWMWFIFPQVKGLGQSEIARHYAIDGLEEAECYLRHPVLGARLLKCAQTLLELGETSGEDIFGFPDNLKLRSSMTLFAEAAESESDFTRVLDQYFQGGPDHATLELLPHRA